MAENQVTQAKYAYPKYKVYIFGIDVTDDVTSISREFHDGTAPNTCMIQLQSPGSRYITTTADVASLRLAEDSRFNADLSQFQAVGEVSGQDPGVKVPGAQIRRLPDAKKINLPWMRNPNKPDDESVVKFDSALPLDPIKSKILAAKFGVTQSFDASLRKDVFGKSISTIDRQYYGRSLVRYPFADGSPIFHPNDPVRVFMRDPFDPSRWYHHFAGLVSDMVEQVGSNNEQELTIQAEDPTKILRYTRIFTNPGVLDAKRIIQEEDLKVQSFNAHYFKGFDLPEIVFTVIFGPDKTGAEKLQQRVNGKAGGTPSPLNTKLRGVGHFAYDLSQVYTFGPQGEFTQENAVRAQERAGGRQRDILTTNIYTTKPPEQLGSLAEWQYLIDNEVTQNDLYTMAREEDRKSGVIPGRIQAAQKLGADGLIDIEWVIDYIGTNTDLYLIDGGRVLILLPNSLGPGNKVVALNDFIASYPMNSEWNSAAEVLYDMVGRLEFSMYCTPRGDLVIEPPLYDLKPDDFGMEPVSEPGGAVKLTGAREVFPSRPRGPFGPNYVIRTRDTISLESAYSDDKVHTIAVVAKEIFPGWETLPNTSIIGDLIVVTRPELIPIYGARQLPSTSRQYVSSNEGASYFANIRLNEVNADAHSAVIQIDTNIKLYPNRPVYVQKRNFMATIRRVQDKIVWGARGSMDTTLDVGYVRSWKGEVDANDVPIYETIGGTGGNPLDYSKLFRLRSVPKNPTDPRIDSSGLPAISNADRRRIIDVEDFNSDL